MTLISQKYLFSYISYDTLYKIRKQVDIAPFTFIVYYFDQELIINEYYPIEIIGCVKVLANDGIREHVLNLYIANHRCLRFDTGLGEIVLGRNVIMDT